MPACPTVQKHHTFFFDTKLSANRMQEISDWIGELSLNDRKKLEELIEDVKEYKELDFLERQQ